MSHHKIFLGAAMLLCSSLAHARPLLTEEAVTAGKFTFDANITMNLRNDRFGTPTTKYRTIRFPWQARLGLSSKLDAGLMFNYLSQRLDQGGRRYTGSTNDLFSTFVKYVPFERLGVIAFWHTKRAEKGDQALPIGRGDDIEALVLYSLPTRWPVTFNGGYIHRDPYTSKLGINAGSPVRIRPGNIIQLKASVQKPLPANFSLLNELAYYSFEQQKIGSSATPNSAGEALDALVGLSWDYKGWNLGGGVSFGLLDERHTSFAIERGAGDVTYHLRIGYKLVPHRLRQ